MADISLLHSLGTVVQFEKNQTVFTQNDAGENMYIVLKGLFGVYINSFTDFPARVAGIQSGSFFGEMSVIDGWPRSATIISEDNGTALVIEKDNFELLLEKSPDVATSILNTLRSRATSTAEAVYKTGKEAPALPPLSEAAQCTGAKRIHSFMILLAQHIRQLNDLLVTSPVVHKVQIAPASKDAIKLLPEGYAPFHLEDQNDNRKMLIEKKVICPHCFKETDAYIPLFSKLQLKESTYYGRMIYRNLDILWYTNVVCPNCNYTDTYQEFSKFRPNAKKIRFNGNQFVNAEGFTGFAATHNHSLDEVILSYYLNIASLKRTVMDPLRLAKAWIRLFWLYDDNKNEALAKQAAKESQKYYAVYSHENDKRIGTEDKMRVNAILGELSIVTRDFEQAKEYFRENTVIGRMQDNNLLKESLRRYQEIKRL